MYGIGLIIGIVAVAIERYIKRLEKRTPVAGPVSDLMDENYFWQLIDDSLVNSSDPDSQRDFLISELEKLEPEEIIKFRLRIDKLLYDTYDSLMWCAAYLMNGGCSDDGFEYFRFWLISRGKSVYQSAKENPDWLVTQLGSDSDVYFSEDLSYAATYAFYRITMKTELYDWVDESFKFNAANYPEIEFGWQEDDPESMRAICPNIYQAIRSQSSHT